jgi:hypothetical protein
MSATRTGARLVVRNGTHQPREVLTAAGAVEVVAPRVNDRRTDPQTGERCRFSSAILPPWCRKTPKITEVLPLLYLHGLSTGDFVPALGQFLGSSAGLSAPVISKLTETWKAEQRSFAVRDLSGVDYVYLWADGIHVNIRLEEHKLCLLVLIGVRADGRKELVALTDGYRESTESWADLLRDCARRGMRAPVLAVGDGALEFWGALREVFPATGEQRCWFHYADLRIMPTLTQSVLVSGGDRAGLIGIIRALRGMRGAGRMTSSGRALVDSRQSASVLLPRGPVGVQVDQGGQSRLWSDHAAPRGAQSGIAPPPAPGGTVARRLDYADQVGRATPADQHRSDRGRHNPDVGIMELMPTSA